MTSVTARHVSFSLSHTSRIALGATTLQLDGRSQVTTSLEHYVTRIYARAVSSRSPSVYRLFPYRASKSPKRAPRSVSRAPRARARATRTRRNTRRETAERSESSGPHRSSPPVHQRSLRYRSLRYRSPLVDVTPRDQTPRSPSDSSRGYCRGYSRVLLHEYYSRAITRTTATFDLPARRVRNVLGDTVSAVRHLE